jgi:hypothetical protein
LDGAVFESIGTNSGKSAGQYVFMVCFIRDFLAKKD